MKSDDFERRFSEEDDFVRKHKESDETRAGDEDLPDIEDLIEKPGGRGTRIIGKEEPLKEEGLFSWLVAVEGDYKGKMFQLFKGQNLIGRGDRCHIQLSDDSVSEIHAVIKVVEDRYSIWDLGSTNGTKVNGEQLTSERELVDDDRILVGGQKLVFKRVGKEAEKEKT